MQTATSQTRQHLFHRFSQLVPDAPLGISQDLWTHRTQKGLLPAQVQHP